MLLSLSLYDGKFSKTIFYRQNSYTRQENSVIFMKGWTGKFTQPEKSEIAMQIIVITF